MPTAAAITMLAMDVDGTLTDGAIRLHADGSEMKVFDCRDGLGISAWHALGFASALITGRRCPAVEHRAAELGIAHIIQGAKSKSDALDRLLAESGVSAEQTAYVGDDWNDLPILRRVGYPISVADASAEVRRVARFVTAAPGGRGAVREAVEHLLGVKGLMRDALALYD